MHGAHRFGISLRAFSLELDQEDISNVKIVFDVIYQTRETVFHRDIQTRRRELKILRAAEYF